MVRYAASLKATLTLDEDVYEAAGHLLRVSVESHVIPAKLVLRAGGGAGIDRAWVPAYAGTTAFVTFISMGGPQAHGHSE